MRTSLRGCGCGRLVGWRTRVGTRGRGSAGGGLGRRLVSPALIADGYHARTDGLVSLAVVASAIFVALGAQIADPLIGMVVTIVILRITWQSYLTVRADPGTPIDPAHDHAH